MQVTVNGQTQSVEAGTTVRQLIERLKLGNAACAAEVNKRLVPRKSHESHQLREGDVVEIVSLVGGG